WNLRITTISPPTLGSIADQTLDEGTTLNVPISASDPDGGTLTLSTTGLPAFASLNVTDSASGSISANLVLTPGYYSHRVYSGVTVTVSDGACTDSKSFSITV